jgi:hypothetical protein
MSFGVVRKTSIFISNYYLPYMLDLEIMGTQFEIERIFSLAKILINLKICRRQIGNLDKLIFTSKN